MFTVKGLDHIVLNTAQLGKMLQFYCHILGCTIEKENPAVHLTQLRAGDSLIDIIEQENYRPAANGNVDHFCLRITPFKIDNLIHYFNQHQVKILDHGIRYGAQGDGYSIYINDPEGNQIELKEMK